MLTVEIHYLVFYYSQVSLFVVGNNAVLIWFNYWTCFSLIVLAILVIWMGRLSIVATRSVKQSEDMSEHSKNRNKIKRTSLESTY